MIQIRIRDMKGLLKPDWIQGVVKGNDCVEPGTYEFTFEEFLRPGEEYVSSDEMVIRAKANGSNTGLQHALHLLEYERLIPAEFRNRYLIFADAEAVDFGKTTYVAFLYVFNGRWVLGWRLLWLVSNRNDLLVRACKIG